MDRSSDAVAVIEPRRYGKAELSDSLRSHFSKVAAQPADEERGKPAPSPKRRRALVLFRFTSHIDLMYTVIGLVGAAVNGALNPVYFLIFGWLVNDFGNLAANQSFDFMGQVQRNVLYVLYIAIGAMLSGYVRDVMSTLSGKSQAARARSAFLEAALHQEMGWFDAGGAEGVLESLNEEAGRLQQALGERLPSAVRNLTMLIVGLGIAFSRGWDLTLVMMAGFPFMAGVGLSTSAMSRRMRQRASRSNSAASSTAQQALTNIRTVASYGLEARTMQQYESLLELPLQAGIKQGLLSGVTLGAASATWFCSYALALWYGAVKVADGNYNGGQVLSVMFAAMNSGFCLGEAVPQLRGVEEGRAAAAAMAAVVDRQPAIAEDAQGAELTEVRGDIELQDVHFCYPSRPDRQVLCGFSLSIPAGSTVALVGESGSGKSSVIQLLERFYDPQAGRVLLDGFDLRTLRLCWMRSQMALVSQEPALFDAAVCDNIASSRPGANMMEVVAAAKAANAHEFIERLPQGYQTPVGQAGGQLSGGQRQRIAIARAILRNARVLLLDEATSALDMHCEQVVQTALESAAAGRTVVVVAHRLSTVANADIIAAVRGGRVVEQGTHGELRAKPGGFYAGLVTRQEMSPNDDRNPSKGSTAEQGGAIEATPFNSRRKPQAMRESVLQRSSVRLSIIPADLLAKLGAGKDEDDKPGRVGFSRLMALNRPELVYTVVGAAACALLALQMPGSSLAMAGVIQVYYEPTPDEIRAGGTKYALINVGIGLGSWVMSTLQGWCFAVMGCKLSNRVRLTLMRSILNQEIGWFDQKENGVGQTLSRLSADCMALRGAVGDQIGALVQNLAVMVASYAVAFSASWSMTLVITALLPLLILSQVAHAKILAKQHIKDGEVTASVDQLVTEAMGSIRVVTAYGLQPSVANRFRQEVSSTIAVSRIHLSSLMVGVSELVLYGVHCLAFWFGSVQVYNRHISFEQMMQAYFATYFIAVGLSQAQQQFPDMATAHAAVQRVFAIIDRKPAIDATGKDGTELPLLEGDVELRNVTFAYPTRPDSLILKHFDLMIPKGTSCALVGESGHGKSTIVGLLERFYEPLDGQVIVDGVNVKSLSTRWLRSKVGLVGQDAVVFNTSILENIRMGSPDATNAQVADAACMANAMDFIKRLPEELSTKLGPGGIQLSGGQRQRIAIARAILRDPKILLLDEATSALDAESEKSVQDALDKFMIGRTSIIVAHRLSTIRSADKIAAVYRGRVMEQGSHDELMTMNRYYAYLVSASQV